MTTYSTTTRIRHDSDATFQEWIQEFHTGLTTVGCVQTADTGQLTLASATRPGINSDAGYTIYYMNDSMHGTSPIYFKIYWGTGAATDRMRIRVEVGTGSNGTGTITNPNTAYQDSTTNTSGLTTDTTYPSYFCLANGCLSVFHKIGRPATGFAQAGFVICRSCDSNGAADANGFIILHHNNSSSISAMGDIDAFDYVHTTWGTRQTSGFLLILPVVSASTGANPNGDVETVICHYMLDRVRPFPQILGAALGDFVNYSTYSLTPMGATARTMICMGNPPLGYLCGYLSSTASAAYGTLIIYE